MTWKEKAEALGVTDRSLRTYRKSPDFPESGTLEQMRQWILDKSAGLVGPNVAFSDMTDAQAVSAKRRAEAKLTAEKALLAELERKEKEGELVQADDVAAERQRAAVTLQNQLLNMPSEARQWIEAGASPGEVEARMGDRLRTLISQACDEGMGQ